MDNCKPNTEVLDGRGNLSEEALVDFTRFLLKMCIDQVEFMEKIVQPSELRPRIHLWVDDEAARKRINPKAGLLLDAILYRGQVPRGEVAQILGLSTRYSRDTVTSLTEEGVITSETPYGPLRIVFTAKVAPRWMPGLFPEPLASS